MLVSISNFLLLGSIPATGHDVLRTDPDDVNTMDIQSVLYRHGDGRTLLKVRFFNEVIEPQFTYPNDAQWAFYTTGDNQIDFTVEYEYRSLPQDYFCFLRDSTGALVRRVAVIKRPYSVKCSFRSRLISGLAERFYVTDYDNGGFDKAPNNGAYTH